ncbi:uncharacterized protein ARMOST_21740 [Armillaria ostoyae]|uniref:Uncharacterized protein n=1 Tax=Armillaria ostoyae TaxID=47428 RepID=A0A284SAW2_ARMOS|nr:uncharacterized protein ARMOST_21740 [Armillaria ostoyae]
MPPGKQCPIQMLYSLLRDDSMTDERLGMKINYGSTGSCGVSRLAVGGDKCVNALVLYSCRSQWIAFIRLGSSHTAEEGLRALADVATGGALFGAAERGFQRWRLFILQYHLHWMLCYHDPPNCRRYD